MIQVQPNSPLYYLSTIYVSADSSKRARLWENLIEYSSSLNAPWLSPFDWIISYERIVSHTLNYFQKCFTSDHVSTNRTHIYNSPMQFSSYCSYPFHPLDKPLEAHEIQSVIFFLKPYKAPDPDDLHLIFTNTIGKLFIKVCWIVATAFLTLTPCRILWIQLTFALFQNIRMLIFLKTLSLLLCVIPCKT